MTESEKLIVVRDKLIARRRMLVDHFQKIPAAQMTGESLAEVQNAIEAVNRAIEEETHIEPRRRAIPA